MIIPFNVLLPFVHALNAFLNDDIYKCCILNFFCFSFLNINNYVFENVKNFNYLDSTLNADNKRNKKLLKE